MTHPQKTALVIGASGYIGGAVARTFANSSYLTLGLIRSSSSDPHGDLAAHNIQPVVGSTSDIPAVVASIQSYSKVLDVIVLAIEDRTSNFESIVELVSNLAKMSKLETGIKPLVIYTSGCKDYGPGELDGTPDLKPHTEETPLRTPLSILPRAQHALQMLEYPDLFDAVVTRPTNVHGYSSSYFGGFFGFAVTAKKKQSKLVFPGDARTIMHSVHVEDCAEAYLAIAEHPDRRQVAGEIFNISPGQKYETLGAITSALEKEFGFDDAVECEPQELSPTSVLFAWTQWVGSEKLRELTGWKDTRPMFAEDLGRYRKEFETAVREDDVTHLRLKPRFEQAIKYHFSALES